MLGGAFWLGMTDLPPPRIVDLGPQLLIRAERPVRVAELRARLGAIGMREADGFPLRTDHWPPPAPTARTSLADVALVIRAEDSRVLARLPADLALVPDPGGPALGFSVPDRGPLTDRLVWPWLVRHLQAVLDAGGETATGALVRRQDGRLQLQALLSGPARGSRAPTVPRPRLRAPVLRDPSAPQPPADPP